MWCCEKLNCCVLKEDENFIRCCFKTKQTKKKEETKKKQKRDYSFCKITLKTIDYREDDDEDQQQQQTTNVSTRRRKKKNE